MKPEEKINKGDIAPQTSEPHSVVEGDVIGKTAYSQRFVLKLLLKIANLETLQEAITKDKTFEDDLCLLWDMSSDKDVVLYLQEHNALKLIQFALPSIRDNRILEIIIGIVGNMCCHEEIVREIIKMDSLLNNILRLLKVYDTGILTVVFRLVEVCVFRSSKSDVDIWLSLFNLVDYSEILYFTLKNSSNSSLLLRALESLNTVSARCNEECYKTNFYLEFVNPVAIESILAAFTEITLKQKDEFDDDIIERINNITIQIIMYLLSMPFNKSYEIFKDSKNDIAITVSSILLYYKEKFEEDKIISADLSDIGEPILFIAKKMHLYEVSYDKIIPSTYELWNTLNKVVKSQEDFKTRETWESLEDDKEFSEMINEFYSKLICYYLEACDEDDLKKALDLLVVDLDYILNATKDETIKEKITKRTSTYVNSIK